MDDHSVFKGSNTPAALTILAVGISLSLGLDSEAKQIKQLRRETAGSLPQPTFASVQVVHNGKSG
jgi:hypothetical protein